MKVITGLVFFFAAQLANAQFFTPFSAESDSGIDGPAYAAIETELVQLQVEYPALAQRVVYGKSVKGANLNLIRIATPNAQQNIGRAVVITGATHGNEYLGIEDKLPRVFLAGLKELPRLRDFLMKGGIVYIAPIFNPDGYAADGRGNANGIDLNRDFPLPPTGKPGFTQPETKFFVDYLRQDLTKSKSGLSVAIDYHCCIGAFLYPWSYTNVPLAEPELKRFETLGAFLKLPFGDTYKLGTTYSVLGYYAYGTSKDYYYGTTGALAYTFEGRYRTEKDNLVKHVAMWESVFAYLAQ